MGPASCQSSALGVAALLVAFSLVQGDDPYKTGAWSYMNYPNPQKDVRHCGRRGNASYVCDPNHMITFEEANQLDMAIKHVISSSKCPCSQYACDGRPGGYKIGVILVKKMVTVPRGASFEMKNNGAKDFTFHLYNNGWGQFGRCGEVVLLLYSQEDELLYTMTGNAAREKIDDDTLYHILQKSSEVTEEKGIYKGLRDAVDRLGRAAQGQYDKTNGASVVASVTSLIAAAILIQYL